MNYGVTDKGRGGDLPVSAKSLLLCCCAGLFLHPDTVPSERRYSLRREEK
jgi:hypothetical protein